MNQHADKHQGHGHGKHEQHAGKTHGSSGKGLHRDWRVWVAVVLMLAAMAVYVMSLDESIEPDGKVQPAVPAAG